MPGGTGGRHRHRRQAPAPAAGGGTDGGTGIGGRGGGRRRQEAAGMARYHEKWRQELRRNFNRENYYVTPEGLQFFWQMYAIAPWAEGVPTFSLPFGEQGCAWPIPESLTRLQT